ncbi:MAG: GGDEF domain-containing protein [Gammaproteobacteria bacterium]|nr:GGDEF domain-containing protein [Gammaproteobacteria bacterium]
MLENKLFEALLDVIPFSAYAVDINTYEVIYANKISRENMYAPQENFCWEKIYGQNEICSWCSIYSLQQDKQNNKHQHEFFDEIDDKWMSSYDEIMSWPDGRTVKYTILVDISKQKEAQGDMIRSHAKLAVKSKQIAQTNKQLQITKLNLQKTIRELEESKAELKLLASTDPMTGLYNRRYFKDVSEHIFNISKRENKSLSVLMLDIDKFKRINDTFGHQKGDEVIMLLASILQKHARKSDIISRFGGEEFLILLPETAIDGANTIAEKIRTNIRTLDIEVEVEKDKIEVISITFTVSAGVSTINFNQDLNIEAAINRADKALYQAKESGRNRVCSLII